MMDPSPAPSPLLQCTGLSVGYGKVEAVHEVSLAVAPRRIVTVVGPNGAGKTTTMAAIMGLLPSTGRIVFDGRDLAGTSVEERVYAGLSLVPESRELFAEMTVADNLELGGLTRQRRDRRGRRGLDTAFAEVYQLFPRLQERRTQLAGTLSGGERQMLALGRALMGAPRLLMLDEPSLGLAPLIVREIFQIIANLRQRGTSILLVEQNARAALKVADEGHVLENGRIALSGPSARLLDDEQVIASYLGIRSAQVQAGH
jgi:branched-chain amino acid transport system ATP-binding protein